MPRDPASKGASPSDREVEQAVDDAMAIYTGNTFAHEVILLELLTRLREILGEEEIAQILARSERSMLGAAQSPLVSQQIATALQTLNILGQCLGYGNLFGHRSHAALQ